ncbi:hypothetical protein BJV78DRAFT_217498 [Lactifluus subvellereus]|nr:hypothetical protein BJV78DRAFT_217498 [Lactifluus subvellereus]
MLWHPPLLYETHPRAGQAHVLDCRRSASGYSFGAIYQTCDFEEVKPAIFVEFISMKLRVLEEGGIDIAKRARSTQSATPHLDPPLRRTRSPEMPYCKSTVLDSSATAVEQARTSQAMSPFNTKKAQSFLRVFATSPTRIKHTDSRDEKVRWRFQLPASDTRSPLYRPAIIRQREQSQDFDIPMAWPGLASRLSARRLFYLFPWCTQTYAIAVIISTRFCMMISPSTAIQLTMSFDKSTLCTTITRIWKRRFTPMTSTCHMPVATIAAHHRIYLLVHASWPS